MRAVDTICVAAPFVLLASAVLFVFCILDSVFGDYSFWPVGWWALAAMVVSFGVEMLTRDA